MGNNLLRLNAQRLTYFAERGKRRAAQSPLYLADIATIQVSTQSHFFLAKTRGLAHLA